MAERKKKVDKIQEIRALIRPIDYYLHCKELKVGDDPVMVLQELLIIKAVEGGRLLKFSEKLVAGYWVTNRWTGQTYYVPPYHSFIDFDANIRNWKVENGRLYEAMRQVKTWTSWVAVRPLLQAKNEVDPIS